jgi:hypothetical protein
MLAAALPRNIDLRPTARMDIALQTDESVTIRPLMLILAQRVSHIRDASVTIRPLILVPRGRAFGLSPGMGYRFVAA